ncbi:MAG: hypothetical protein ACP5KG_05340 [Myxococcota bacterium]
MMALLIISTIVILLLSTYYLMRVVIIAFKSIFESSRKLYEVEAERLLLSNIKVPVSIIIPPAEEYENLKRVIEATLNVNHPLYQVIVMLWKNCSYTKRLISDFNLVSLNAVYRMVLKSAKVLHTYRSTTDKRLSVIIADSEDIASIINTGFDVSMYPFVCLFSEDYIPTKDMLLQLEPVVIEKEGLEYGSICSASFYEGMKVSQYYIRSIFSFSYLFSLSIPSDFAILLKKHFVIEKGGLKRGEPIPIFLRRMMKKGLKLKYLPDIGLSIVKGGTFLNFVWWYLKKLICDFKLSTYTVLINDIYYVAFLILNILFFYNLINNNSSTIQLFIPMLSIFVIIPLKDLIVLMNESFIRKKIENPFMVKALLLSIFKQFGVEQIISILFLTYSLRRFVLRWRG